MYFCNEVYVNNGINYFPNVKKMQDVLSKCTYYWWSRFNSADSYDFSTLYCISQSKAYQTEAFPIKCFFDKCHCKILIAFSYNENGKLVNTLNGTIHFLVDNTGTLF